MFSFARSSTGDAWFSVGLASSFADLGADDNAVGELRFCGAGPAQGCKVFHVPTTDSSQAVELSAGENAAAQSSDTGADLRDQVLVFQYRGKFHAVDHVSGQIPRDSRRRVRVTLLILGRASDARTRRSRCRTLRRLTLRISASF